uniref:L-serine deaminase n=1 Tax=Rousettus aegyptiacus TaxID=9407 RepID=A0A7J8H6X5_ROUAE|nr:serine dehydratase like [Rousettus aegyptiacus]
MEASLAEPAKGEHFYTVTPLLESWALSQVAGTTVFLKCENVQPAGSFKIRGIGHFCQEVAKKGCRHLVCSSGGNAGIAAAYSARRLGIPATIVLPEGAPLKVVRRLQGEGAEVQLTGKGRPLQPGAGAEGSSGDPAGGPGAGGGGRRAPGRSIGRPGGGGLAARAHCRHGDPRGTLFECSHRGRQAGHPARHHQCGQVPGGQDGGRTGPGVHAGLRDLFRGGGGCGGCERRAAVPG